ncbi:MAG: hypothetical protein U0V87_05320 [Acidobacteriota bacterium]
MPQRAILAAMRDFRSPFLCALLVTLAACSDSGTEDTPVHQTSGDEAGVPKAVIADPSSSEMSAPLGSGPGDPRIPTWPREFRVISSERVGTRQNPVLAYSFETTRYAPEAAIRLLIEAISRVASGTPQVGIAADPSGSSVGQVHATDLAAALHAERRGPTTVVQLLMERARARSN